MKIANINRGNSTKFSGKMCFYIILKVTKNQVSTLSLEDTFFEKPHGGQFDFDENWDKGRSLKILNKLVSHRRLEMVGYKFPWQILEYKAVD